MSLACSEQEGNRFAPTLGSEVNLGTEAALASPQCFVRMLAGPRDSLFLFVQPIDATVRAPKVPMGVAHVLYAHDVTKEFIASGGELL